MGNSFASSRLISLIKPKSSLLRLNWRLPSKSPAPVNRQLVPVSKITALIPYIMPPNRVRASKAASSSSKSKPEVENASNDEGDSDAAEMAVDVKKPAPKGKKKPAKENGIEEKPKSTRGRKKAEPQEEDEDLPEPPKPSARGRKKAAPVEEPPEDPEPKRARGRKKEAPVEEDPEDVPKKSSRGRKKAEAENGDQDEEPKPRGRKKAGSVEPSAPEEGKRSPRGRKKASAKESSEEPEEEPEKPVKRGRKAKLDVVEEAAAPGEEEAEEKAPEKAPGKRGRKPAAKAPEDDEEEEEKPAKRGRKAAKPKEQKEKATKAKRQESGDDDDEPAAKKSKTDEKKKVNKVETNLDEVDFSCEKANAKGERHNLKICSWNVGGIRSITEKKGVEYCVKEDADIVFVQETKCKEGDLPGVWDIPGYKRYYADSEKAGYAGVALFTKVEPIEVKVGLETSPCNDEGRIITAEFEGFYVVGVYVPNAGRGLVTLEKRLQWNEAFKKYVKELDEKKPVIVCGDMNVAHEEIDLANPKTNTKHAGFTKEEREGMTDFLGAGFVDTFRQLYPDQAGAYTFWSYMSDARSRNVGWRLDYFIVSERIKDNVCDNVMRNKVYGSDHCPIVLFANL